MLRCSRTAGARAGRRAGEQSHLDTHGRIWKLEVLPLPEPCARGGGEGRGMRRGRFAARGLQPAPRLGDALL